MPMILVFLPSRLDSDLQPAARRAAEIDDTTAGFDKAEFLVEFEQFERRPRTPAFSFCLRHIGVV